MAGRQFDEFGASMHLIACVYSGVLILDSPPSDLLTLPFPEAGDRAPASSGGAQARTIEESWRSPLGVELSAPAARKAEESRRE